MSLQQEILEMLTPFGVFKMDTLVRRMHDAHPELMEFEIRSAFLPLMSTGLIAIKHGYVTLEEGMKK